MNILFLSGSSVPMKYMGCYRDNKDARDLNILRTFPSSDIESCAEFCQGRFDYFGVQVKHIINSVE